MKHFFIRVLTAAIPFKRARRRIRGRLLAAERDRSIRRLLPVVRARYAAHEASCREKLANGRRLRVAFLVCDASMFSFESVFVQMKNDPRFDCFIALVPRITRGEEFLRSTYAKAVDTFQARYPDSVQSLYNLETRKCRGLEDCADIVFSSIIYEDQTFERFTVEAMSKYALVTVVSYGYGGMFKANVDRTIFLPNIVFSWRYVLANQTILEEWLRHNPFLRRNAVVCGYPKMDRIAPMVDSEAARDRSGVKKVLICPHHTIEGDTCGLRLSTFLRFADFFTVLPALYPDIQFVFRPHPLLFPRLRTEKWWGPERTDAYERKMKSFPNVEFQSGGDYFRTFAESDALIHDCGSFLAEYFYTGKPQCYLLADGETASREFLPFGRQLLEATYHASDTHEIIDFIDRVVVAGEDSLSAKRSSVRGIVCKNHPCASARTIDIVVSAITGGTGVPSVNGGES